MEDPFTSDVYAPVVTPWVSLFYVPDPSRQRVTAWILSLTYI